MQAAQRHQDNLLFKVTMYRSPEPRQRQIDDLAMSISAEHPDWPYRKAMACARLRLRNNDKTTN